ncbi:hypothetical protein IEQ34_006734 [Dendrobium chrysotoxum]|uniref:Uncharacterized protein n=1 Tax=Dendrobium chrysotoxum TaxID=161865 RepID=A0AAV7H7N0_DENCH|nr:hypothetical protein IEQ34_006734 [Dendrobium chrysotoxum]
MGDRISERNPPVQEDHAAHRSEGLKKPHKTPKSDDVISTITEDSFISFRKKIHFPNDLVMKVPARTDCALFSSPGICYGLRFPPSPKLTDILTICGVSLAQLSYRAIAVLSPECLSRMGRLFSDVQGRISFRSKWLNIRTRDSSKGWISDFFYVQNDWKLQEKWGKLKELPVHLHIGAEDLLKILKLPDLDALHYEVRYLSRYIDEEYLFKVGLYTQEGRSSAQMLKSGEDLQAPKKKKVDEAVTSKGPPVSPSKSYIPEDVLKHQCIGRQRAEKLHLEMNKILNDWNNEFVKVKYLQGEYKKKYDGKVKEMKVMEDQLAECRAELANRITAASPQNEQMDHLHIELVEAQETINQHMRDQQLLEVENKKLQKKEAQQLPSAVIEEFKKFYAFKIIIEDHVQEAHNHIYNVEVKDLEAECVEDGFIRGFMKGVRAVQRNTGAEIEGLTPSQASGDLPSDSCGEELESELQHAFSLEEEEDDIDIL